MSERYDKGVEYTEFWYYAISEPPFSDEDIKELRAFMQDNHGTMPLDNPRPPEPALFVADIDFDDDLPF